MNKNENYFSYLNSISLKGRLYRRFFLYPRLRKELNGKCLDVGCGLGDFIAQRPDTFGIDVNPLLTDHCRSRGLEVEDYDGQAIPFLDNEFDCVLLDNVLEHVDKPELLITEIKRVLKSSGKLMIGVPGIRGYAADSDHKVFYDRESLNSLMNSHQLVERTFFEMPIAGTGNLLSMYCIYGVFTEETN